MKPTTLRVLAAGAAAMLIWFVDAPSAQRRGGGNANTDVPIATNTILQNPEAFYGKAITVSAGVEEMLSKTAFLVDQRKVTGPKEVKAIGKPILVIAPSLQAPLDPKHYLLMRGQLVKFDPAAIAKIAADYTIDLPPDVGAKLAGQPVLVATSVINATYVELARKPTPAAGDGAK